MQQLDAHTRCKDKNTDKNTSTSPSSSSKSAFKQTVLAVWIATVIFTEYKKMHIIKMINAAIENHLILLVLRGIQP